MINRTVSQPFILVILDSDSQRVYFERDCQRFNFIFHVLDLCIPPQEQAAQVIHSVNQEYGKIDGVFGVTDEPSILATLIATELGKPGPNPQALYQAQHKAIFAQIAREVNPYYPPSVVIERGKQFKCPESLFPAFIKPAKGSLSMYSYILRNKQELDTLLPQLFRQERPLVTWSNQFYQQFARPEDPAVDSFLLQPFLNFRQYTADGYVFQGQTHLLGITESIHTPDRKSFQRFDFPGALSNPAEKELYITLKKLIRRLKFDDSGFNVEFFVTPEDHIVLIEFNTRLSLQFVPLMAEWYETSNIEIMASICLGRQPVVRRKKSSRFASSCVLRSTENKRVLQVPTQKEVEVLRENRYIKLMRILVEPGKKLSDYEQDAYSYRYALVDVAGKTRREILNKLDYVKRHLRFKFAVV